MFAVSATPVGVVFWTIVVVIVGLGFWAYCRFLGGGNSEGRKKK